MITRMTGRLSRVLDEEVRLEIGPFEYGILVAESVRRHLQLQVGQEITLYISEYFEGNQTGSRLVPRKIGFATEQQLEFFELFCTVEKIGVKKALKAMARNVQEIADAISRQDVKWLTTLPGIGAATAEQIITALKRKVASFAFSRGGTEEQPSDAADAKASRKGQTKHGTPNTDNPVAVPENAPGAKLIEDVYMALQGLGQSPLEARERLDSLLRSGKKFTNLQEAMNILFART